MDRLNIKQKLADIGVNYKDIILGDFDEIGELTAKKSRLANDYFYKFGKYFRPNYERGIMLYYFIRQFKLNSFLELGTGRGYSVLCAGRAFCDAGLTGKLVTIDSEIKKEYLDMLLKNFPPAWYGKTSFVKGKTEEVLPTMKDEKFDLIYIDAAHDYASVMHDWLWAKDRFNKFVVFDDYHIPSEKRKTMDIKGVVDTITEYDKELIITDRRLFYDDRSVSDDDVDYGQVIVYKDSSLKTVKDPTGISDWLSK